MATRSGWRGKKASYRSRLIGAAKSGKLTGTRITGTDAEVEAQTRAYWEAGGDLRSSRSHLVSPSGAAPSDATARESIGQGDERTWKQLERWSRRPPSRGGPPEWLRGDPKKLAKTLERRRGDPIEVTTVGYRRTPSVGPRGEPVGPELSLDTMAILSQIDIPPTRWKAVTMNWLPSGAVVVVVTPKRGYDRMVTLPDAHSASEFGSFLAAMQPVIPPKKPRRKK